jgi:pyruvate/2-oxoacid:ferredoxin oxidoreductase alpha subunit
MLVANAIAEVLKREKVKFIIGYPVNPIIEAAAEADIEPSSFVRSGLACTWLMR